VAKGCLPAITLLLIEFRKLVVVKIIGAANHTLVEALITCLVCANQQDRRTRSNA
jgi:hypothetical protein